MQCTTHADQLAGWYCGACSRALCVDCATGSLEAPACATCGLLVDVLKAPRADVLPFSRTWPMVARTVITPQGLLQVCVLTTAVQLLLSGRGLWALGRALELGWVLFLARRAGVGFDPFGRPRYVDLFSVWLGPMGRLLAGAGVVLAGAAWLVDFGQRAATGVWPWALAVGAVALGPVALVLASVEGEGMQIPWPWRMPASWRQFGNDLMPIAVAIGVAALAEVFDAQLAPFEHEDTRLDVHIMYAWLPHLLSFFALAVAGVLAGHLVRTRAQELGHHDDELVAVLSTPPRGVAAQRLTATRDETRFAPVDLEATSSVETAQVLAGKGEYERAAEVLREALLGGIDDEQTARAMVILARLYNERLARPAQAEALFREVAARYPGTSAARFAEGQLVR